MNNEKGELQPQKTKIAADLRQMRKEWQNAFFALDIQQLDYLEADWFFATNTQKTVYKKHQLRNLERLRSKNPYVYINSRRIESSVQIRELGNLASVSGKAIIGDENKNRQIYFVESWIKLQGAWKLQFQTFETFAEHHSGPSNSGSNN